MECRWSLLSLMWKGFNNQTLEPQEWYFSSGLCWSWPWRHWCWLYWRFRENYFKVSWNLLSGGVNSIVYKLYTIIDGIYFRGLSVGLNFMGGNKVCFWTSKYLLFLEWWLLITVYYSDCRTQKILFWENKVMRVSKIYINDNFENIILVHSTNQSSCGMLRIQLSSDDFEVMPGV